MDLSNIDIGRRPKTARCVRCKKRFAVKPVGPMPIYCSGACKQAVFQKVARLKRRPKPEPMILVGDERQRLFVWDLLKDGGLIPPDKPLPPRRKPEQD